MAIGELVKVVAPPAEPLGSGDAGQWAAIEARLGTRFPGDYRDYALRYGGGVFNDPGRLVIRVSNPFAAGYSDWLRDELESFRGYFGDEEISFDGEEQDGFPVHPESPGLLPWGSDDNGNQLFWYTDGPPDDWPTLFYAHDSSLNDLQRFDMPMTTFLARAFRRKVSITDAWRKPFFTGPRKVKFARTEAEVEYQ